jgi:hypothetical protein
MRKTLYARAKAQAFYHLNAALKGRSSTGEIT